MKQPPWFINYHGPPSVEGTPGRSKMAAAGFNRLHGTHISVSFVIVDHSAGRVPVSWLKLRNLHQVRATHHMADHSSCTSVPAQGPRCRRADECRPLDQRDHERGVAGSTAPSTAAATAAAAAAGGLQAWMPGGILMAASCDG